jgi:hypothetical protein
LANDNQWIEVKISWTYSGLEERSRRRQAILLQLVKPLINAVKESVSTYHFLCHGTYDIRLFGQPKEILNTIEKFFSLDELALQLEGPVQFQVSGIEGVTSIEVDPVSYHGEEIGSLNPYYEFRRSILKSSSDITLEILSRVSEGRMNGKQLDEYFENVIHYPLNQFGFLNEEEGQFLVNQGIIWLRTSYERRIDSLNDEVKSLRSELERISEK